MKQTKEEIEAQIIALLQRRTGHQRVLRSVTHALETLEKELAELLQQLAKYSQP
jgi:DNA repair exonuclease SbcCD ATPase subunit